MAITAYNLMLQLKYAEERLNEVTEEHKIKKEYESSNTDPNNKQAIKDLEKEILSLNEKIEKATRLLKFTKIPIEIAIKAFIDELYFTEGKVYEAVYENGKWGRLWIKTENLLPNRKPKMADVIYLKEIICKEPNFSHKKKIASDSLIPEQLLGTIYELKRAKGIILISYWKSGLKCPNKMYLIKPKDSENYSFITDCLPEDYIYLLDEFLKKTIIDENIDPDEMFKEFI